MKRLRLTPEAELDLDEAYSWYRAQAPGPTASFLGAVGTCIAAIRRHPEAYQLVGPSMRRALLRRFPYAVFYEVGPLIRLLTDDGWRLARTRGSYRQYKHPSKAGTVTVAGKPSLDVPAGTLNAILKQAGLKKEK